MLLRRALPAVVLRSKRVPWYVTVRSVVDSVSSTASGSSEASSSPHEPFQVSTSTEESEEASGSTHEPFEVSTSTEESEEASGSSHEPLGSLGIFQKPLKAETGSRQTVVDFRRSLSEGRRLSIFEPGGAISEEDNRPLPLIVRRNLKSLTGRQRNPWLDELDTSQTQWTYPIDNELAKENDERAGFDEHVFLEREVRDWLPTDGPVRVFMELVINGLQKNPHLTVARKREYLQKMKEHFEKHRDDPTLFPLPEVPNAT